MPVVLTLDAGTGGAKCVAIDHLGNVRGHASERWNYTVVANAEVPMVKEYAFDPDEFWAVVGRCARHAARGVDPGDIVGVVTTSQREGCVFLDAAGREIYAGPNLDSRGFMEGLEVLEQLGASRLYEITGHSAPFIFPIARYLWFRRNDERPISRLLMINDWLAYRAAGVEISEPSNATESMLYDFRARAWSDEIIDRFDVDRTVLPSLGECGQRIGELSASVAEHLGVPANTALHLGGADTQCGLLGVGAFDPGHAAVTLGTTSPVQAVFAEPRLDPAENLWAGCHVVPDRWVLESNCGSTGDAYEWLLDLTMSTAEDRYGAAEEAARGAEPNATFSFSGPRVFDLTKIRPDVPGAIFFPFPSMQLRPDAGQLIRSTLESIAFAVRANLEQITKATGISPTELRVGGGMSRNRLLTQLIANATAIEIHCAEVPESSALGCSALVFGATGLYSDPCEAARNMCRSYTVSPDDAETGPTADRYAKWRALYEALETMSV